MELITTRICMKFDLGVNNNLFGGRMLEILDESGAAYACQICKTKSIVTKKIEEVLFEEAVKEGNIIKVYGEVSRIGNSSITIKLEARKHSVHTDIQKLVCKTSMVFVKIDEEGTPISIDSSIRKNYGNMEKPIKP